MPIIQRLFATRVYQAEMPPAEAKRLNRDLEMTCRQIADDDGAGQAWAREHGYLGYTSYATLTGLERQASAFETLAAFVGPHVAAFARACDFDLGRDKLALDSMWINILQPGGVHTGHIHPHSVVSGTYYVRTPSNTSAIRFEDPRLPFMMAAPLRKPNARADNQTFAKLAPKAGTLLLWESWLRHEVPPNQAKSDRISISFNYA